MLCELLVGQLPQQRRGRSAAQLAQEVSEETVERASTLAARLTTDRVAALYGSEGDARRLAHALSGDLDLIIATALQREPARRYGTAAGFAEDLRRWLGGRTIAARPDSASYRFTRFVRRHRVGRSNRADRAVMIGDSSGVMAGACQRAAARLP
jgi:serine/threonine-protein kinase